MNIVVLGGSGFIGSRLVTQLLETGHRVRIFDRMRSQEHHSLVTLGDVRDRAAVERCMANCDCAINLAAEHRDDVRPASLYTEVNVGGAESVVRSAEAQGVQRILFPSTVAVYGLEQAMPTEAAAIHPFNAYGVSKAAAEAVYAAWAAADPARRTLTVLRPCVVFGEGNRGNVFNLIDQIRRGRFRMVGSGDNRKSVAYVGNLVDFICSRLDAPPGLEIFNYADKPDLSTNELVQQIHALLAVPAPVAHPLPYGIALAGGFAFDLLAWAIRRPLPVSSMRVRKFCAETRVATLALEQSGFQRRFTIAEGLARMVASMSTEQPPPQREP